MNKLAFLFFVLLNMVASAAPTNTVWFFMQDFTASPQAVRRIDLFPLSASFTNGIGQIISRDRRSAITGTNGAAIFTNVYWGSYRSELIGTTTTTTNWFNLPDLSGSNNASVYTTNGPIVPPSDA